MRSFLGSSEFSWFTAFHWHPPTSRRCSRVGTWTFGISSCRPCAYFHSSSRRRKMPLDFHKLFVMSWTPWVHKKQLHMRPGLERITDHGISAIALWQLGWDMWPIKVRCDDLIYLFSAKSQPMKVGRLTIFTDVQRTDLYLYIYINSQLVYMITLVLIHDQWQKYYVINQCS